MRPRRARDPMNLMEMAEGAEASGAEFPSKPFLPSQWEPDGRPYGIYGLKSTEQTYIRFPAGEAVFGS